MVRAGGKPGGGDGKPVAARLTWLSLLLASAGMICSLLGGAAALGGGSGVVSRDDPVEQLRFYLQLIHSAEATRAEDFDPIHEGLAGGGHAIAAGFAMSPRADQVEADSDVVMALRNYVQKVAPGQPESLGAEDVDRASGLAGGKPGEDPHAALHAFVRQHAGISQHSNTELLKLATADNAFDALREFLQKRSSVPPPSEPSLPAAPAARPAASEPAVPSSLVGSKACLECHSSQADTFGYTHMGRLMKVGKLQCEDCHGPGSAHLQAVGCAACHGDGGISKRPGIPSLAGQEPQYLLGAMKAYVSGQRKHSLMKALLSRLGDAELNDIALYYARQSPARALTPPVGDPSAGKAATALCSSCHGEQGVSVYPGWPSLAGQDAQYLANSLKAYKDGSRSKTIACAGCHGDGGVSRRPGVPSLAGLDPSYLVLAMKGYVNGQRKHPLMKALLTGVAEAELKTIAQHYGRQTAARAQTSAVGDPSAGKGASEACAGCHGEQGVSENPEWPSLAGQEAQYLADALKAYKNGQRSDELMKGMAESLDERTIANLAAYYSSLRPAQPHPSGASSPAVNREPVVVRNALVASLDLRTINNIASYYASLSPGQPRTARDAPKHVPALVLKAAPVGGRSLGGIISFRRDDPSRTAEDNNRICLRCHERGERTNWHGSVHEERGLACTECHTIMRSVSAQYQLKTAFEPETCFACHKDRRAQMFRSAHMPVREGKVVCSDCHNPHGSFTEALLREVSVNDTCYKCHAEKRGPFLFEHAPVRENCLSCHDPHGSINEFSLKMSRPRLCYECHTIGHGQQGPGTVFTMSRACQNCHTQIHGSNSPAGGALQR